MNKIGVILLFLIGAINIGYAQDTFSIVAVDTATGEVGSAGASCVNLSSFPGFSDDFLGVLIPNVGAINTQAFYLQSNQNNATNQMNQGLTPTQIINWLVANDVQSMPELRQYGIAALGKVNPSAAAHTGTGTDDYKGQRVGTTYAIQGNILLGPEVLDSMESRFLNTEGDLACKLMAAMQGANIVGADSRCAPFGTSSLFAFLKVAQPTDVFGSPSFLVSVRTAGSQGIEPIDSLQTLFDNAYLPSSTEVISTCDSFTWIDGITYTQSTNNAVFRIVGGAANGCDSLVRLNLDIPPTIDASVSTSDSTLTVNTSEAIYQWLDCKNGFTPIDGATEQVFTASEEGQYAVAITANGCTDTSECVAVTLVGIASQVESLSIELFPNPTNSRFTLEFSDLVPTAKVVLRDVQGRAVKRWQLKHTDRETLELTVPSGYYQLEVTTKEQKQVMPLVKQ